MTLVTCSITRNGPDRMIGISDSILDWSCRYRHKQDHQPLFFVTLSISLLLPKDVAILLLGNYLIASMEFVLHVRHVRVQLFRAIIGVFRYEFNK